MVFLAPGCSSDDAAAEGGPPKSPPAADAVPNDEAAKPVAPDI